MPEILKALPDITVPDPRNLGWRILNQETGVDRELTLAEHHASVAALGLSLSVPDDILTLYNTARNALLYSWYVYRFITVAELQAYGTLEYALRWHGGHLDSPSPPTLGPLLRQATRAKLITDDTFRNLREQYDPPVFTGNALIDANIDPQLVLERGHVELLCKTLPGLRNQLAHGSTNIWPNATATFLVVRAAIEAICVQPPTAAS